MKELSIMGRTSNKRSRRKRRNRPRRAAVKKPDYELPELLWIPYMDTWMWVVGYTDGGAPYGTTVDEYSEPWRSELLVELEAGRQPDPPVLDEVEINPFALWFAGSADELHRMLVLEPSGRSIANHFEPTMLLLKHHKMEPETTLTSALLMLTDLRWKGGVGRLAGWLAGSGILDDEGLGLLARTFLLADEALYWKLPDHWPMIELVLSEDPESPESGADDQDRPMTVARTMFPPLRRWAAEYLAGSDPTGWAAIYSRAKKLPSKHAAAVIAGLLDACGNLAPATQELLTAVAVDWPDQSVRRIGYRLLAERGDPEGAYRLASTDPSATVRSWSKVLLKPPPVERPNTEAQSTPPSKSPPPAPPQEESLF